MQRITGHEYPISKIFSEEFDFHIPSYQRPYAWTTEQAGELIDDLLGFMDDQPDGDDPYFLGSIVLIKEEGRPRADVIDGQQRLTTLTILLAALRARISGENGAALERYINEPGNPAEDRAPQPRLTPRDRDLEIFRRHIQSTGGLPSLLTIDSARLSDPQRNIQANARLYVERLAAMGENAAFRFARFVLNRCYLVAVATPSMQSAYRIFSVLNDRGLDLLTCDILKSDIIGSTPPGEREAYTNRWEEIEDDLGRDAFNELFGHIRMIYVRAKAKKTVLEEFREGVLHKEKDGCRLIDAVIEPYAEAIGTVTRANYESTHGAERVNELLRWLKRLDNIDWIPPAIMFMRRHQDQPGELAAFYERLERLAASMFIRRVPVTKRIERYAKVIGAIESGAALAEGSDLDLTPDEQSETLERLDGDLYNAHHGVRSYVLLRLDSWLSDRGAIYDHDTLTVEHVLPQTMRPDGEWASWWTAEEQQAWVHRVGNLVLLTRKKNSSAQNFEFGEKKSKYFRTQQGVSSFTITTQVLNQTEWTPAVVAARQREMVERLARGWGLDGEPS